MYRDGTLHNDMECKVYLSSSQELSQCLFSYDHGGSLDQHFLPAPHLAELVHAGDPGGAGHVSPRHKVLTAQPSHLGSPLSHHSNISLHRKLLKVFKKSF